MAIFDARDVTCCSVSSPFCGRTQSETESVAGRQFAMMAARGLDILWILCFLSLAFFSRFVSGSPNGMYSICLWVRF